MTGSRRRSFVSSQSKDRRSSSSHVVSGFEVVRQVDGREESLVVTVGDKRNPAVLLIHGQPSSANSFRDIWSCLAEVAHVVAPDLPGFGQSDVVETTTFDKFAVAVTELLDHLEVGERFIYLHDFGAPVGFRIAMDHPELVRGLIVQSANAHQTGLGPQWQKTMEYWSHPNAENEAAATAHLTLEGVRSTYVRGLPDDVARKIWMEDLPRMEVHILDGGHFLLETHAEPAGELMRTFIAHAGHG